MSEDDDSYLSEPARFSSHSPLDHLRAIERALSACLAHPLMRGRARQNCKQDLRAVQATIRRRAA